MRNKQHLIAIDLDGTMLNNKNKISEETKKIITKAISKGHIVMIATGRSFLASAQYYQQLELTTPIVNFNGSLIHHPYDEQWKKIHNPVSHLNALGIIDVCYELNMPNILAEVQNSVFLDKHDQYIIDHYQSSIAGPEKYPFTIGSLKDILKDDPTSLLVQPKEEHLYTFKDYLNNHQAEFVEHRSWSGALNVLEITKKGMSKAIGISKIAAHYNIPKNRIIAFGDENNDLEMIDYAGVGVAMGNAIDELKSIAKHVTDTNEENGIKTFLKDYLNLKVS